MTQFLSSFLSHFLLGAEKKEKGWAMDTSDLCLRTHLRANLWYLDIEKMIGFCIKGFFHEGPNVLTFILYFENQYVKRMKQKNKAPNF